MLRRTVDWAFRDRRSGAIVIGQWPNLPLWLFIGAVALSWLVEPSGAAGSALRVLASASLLAWGLDELMRGANPWRRCLGVAGIAYAGWRLAAGA